MTETDTSRLMSDDDLLSQINAYDPYDVEFVRRYRALLARAYQVGVAVGKASRQAEIDSLLARAEKAEAERDTAWNDAIEAAAQTQIDKANYWSSLCNDDERCHYEAIAGGNPRPSQRRTDMTGPNDTLTRLLAEARADGRREGLREAAVIADGLFYPDETKISAKIRDAILALLDAPKQEVESDVS